MLFSNLKIACKTHSKLKAVKMRHEQKALAYRGDKLFEKAISSWKKYSYRVRVKNYLQN